MGGISPDDLPECMQTIEEQIKYVEYALAKRRKFLELKRTEKGFSGEIEAVEAIALLGAILETLRNHKSEMQELDGYRAAVVDVRLVQEFGEQIKEKGAFAALQIFYRSYITEKRIFDQSADELARLRKWYAKYSKGEEEGEGNPGQWPGNFQQIEGGNNEGYNG